MNDVDANMNDLTAGVCVLCGKGKESEEETHRLVECNACRKQYHASCGDIEYSRLDESPGYISICPICKSKDDDESDNSSSSDDNSDKNDDDTEKDSTQIENIPNLHPDHVKRIEMFLIDLEDFRDSFMTGPPIGATIEFKGATGTIMGKRNDGDRCRYTAQLDGGYIYVYGLDRERGDFTLTVPPIAPENILYEYAVALGCSSEVCSPTIRLKYEFKKARAMLLSKKLLKERNDGSGTWYSVDRNNFLFE